VIFTQHNDNRRSGANLNEALLKPSNVNVSAFGKLFELPVVGSTYAQPLFVPNVTVRGRQHNVLYVATMHNEVYAFDAENGARLWQRQLGKSVMLPNGEIGPGGYKDMEWEVGILSTPVIDTDRHAMYVVATSQPSGAGSIMHQLFMLDLATGNDLKPARTIGASAGRAAFVSHKQDQRSALLLSDSRVYVTFASYGDAGPYHGWVLGFEADTLAPAGTFCSTPQPNSDNGEGGIWMAGQGPAADEQGNLYLMTGNGDFNPASGNFGDCVLKLDRNLNRVDFFSPHNNGDLDRGDKDLGSGGILAIPGTEMVIGGGKEAFMYLMDMNHLGGFDPNTDHVLDKIAASKTDGGHHIHGSPVFWNGPDGPRIYVWTENDQCKAFQLVGRAVNHNPVAQSNITVPDNFPGGASGMPGGFLTISAEGARDGILWAAHPWSEDLNQKIGEGVLRALDALTLHEFWNSRQNQARDDYGNFAKFCPPTVANGKVYMATMGGLSHKVTLGETALGGPAMINRNNADLVLGWSGTDNPSHLNVIFSTDGLHWANKVTIPNETTPNALALAFDGSAPGGGRTFIAWTGTDSAHSLNVMSSQDHALHNWGNKHTLGEQSHHGPVLQMFNGRLFIAWTGTDNRLNVMSSGDLGATWQNKRTLNETSPTEPALAVFGGKLILMWNGTDSANHLNFIESSDHGLTWGDKITLGDTSGHHPAMVTGPDGIPYFCWAGSGNELLNVLHSENGATNGFLASPNYKRTFYDTASNGPCLCSFKGKVLIGWTGTDSGAHVNVAQLSRGAVVVYGPLR
jgi:outer membrane protein assembly factor BamB